MLRMKKWLLILLLLLLTSCGAGETVPTQDSYPVVRELPAPTEGASTLYAVTLQDRAAYDEKLTGGCAWWKDPVGFYQFRFDGDTTPDAPGCMWYPWLYEGRIHEFYWVYPETSMYYSKTAGGKRAEALHALAPLTSAETPLFIAVYGDSTFALIGGSAYLVKEGLEDIPETLPALDTDGFKLTVVSFSLET